MPEVEMLMLANHAEVLNGLLYVQGAGWTHHWRAALAPGQSPPPSQIAIAATFILDPTETAPSQPFTIRVRDEEGEEILRADGNFEVGGDRPRVPEHRRLAFGANVGIVFPHEGRYTVAAEAMGYPALTVEFWVHDAAAGEGRPEAAPIPGPPRTTGGYI
jgi:hypothetical protein